MKNTRPDLNQTTLDKIKAQMPAKRTAVSLPPAFRHVIECNWFRTFSWWERLLILCGSGLHVLIRIPTLHKPGELDTLVKGFVSKHTKPEEVMVDEMREYVKKVMPPAYLEQEQEAKK